MERPHFVATPWRDGSELLELRRWFYGGNSGAKGNGEADRRRDGVDKVRLVIISSFLDFEVFLFQCFHGIDGFFFFGVL